MAPAAEVPYGTLDLMVLNTLAALGPLHGFGIARRIEQVSRGVFKVNPGSLLTAFQRLERVGWLDSEWRQTENSRRAKFYWLTRTGRKQLDVEVADWNRRASAIARLLKVEG
jgi:PadR family transcriptional regulator